MRTGNSEVEQKTLTARAPVVQIFPVAIGHYVDFPDLDVDAQVNRLLDLLASFDAGNHPWATPALERGASATERRLLEWANAGGTADEPPNSVLYWVGHGWSDGTRAALAHTDSPARVGAAGVTPEQLADAIRTRQSLVQTREGSGGEGEGWALVVVDTCRSKRFAELVAANLKTYDPPQRVVLVGVSGEGSTTLGRFTDALRRALTTAYKANSRIALTDLADQFPRLMPGCEVSLHGDLTAAALVPVFPPVASWMSAPLDMVRHLEEVMEDLSLDERHHFLIKAQGAEQGEMSWFFEGREWERAQIASWLRDATSGMLVVTGRAGSGKSALLGNVLVHSLPGLREALARRGLVTTLSQDQTPPGAVFDAVIHLSGLTLSQITGRLAAAAELDSLPSRSTPEAGIANDLDWLTACLSERTEPFTVLADALDEATDPLDTARSLLARIAALPRIRVLVGTRASTTEAPDEPAIDEDLLDALAGPSGRRARRDASDDGGDATQGILMVWVGRDQQAIRRYVRNRLQAVRDHGVAGRAVPYLADVREDDFERVAAEVSDRDNEFLFARLAVYELIADPLLLSPRRAWSLKTLLDGDHQDLFAKALDRLASRDDRYPILLEALSLAHGRGLPEADGIWASIATALTPSPEPATIDATDPGVAWAQAISGLLGQAAAYITIDADAVDRHTAIGPGDPDEPSTLSAQARSGTVYRLAHHTFVEYFTARAAARQTQSDRHRRAASALLHTAAQIAATGPSHMPTYLARYLSGHAAETDLWDELADHSGILDFLDPHAVTADALRSLFGRKNVPPPVVGVIGARDALTDSAPTDRVGLRHLATTIHSSQHVIDEPIAKWGIAAAQVRQATVHVRLSGHTAGVCKVCSLTLPNGRAVLASASHDGTIRLWDPGTATPIGTPLTGHTGAVYGICPVPGRGAVGHPHRRTLLASAGSDGTIRLWDPDTERQVGDTLIAHAGRVWEVCAMPGRGAVGHPHRPTLLASAGEDGAIRVWDPGTGQQVGDTLTGHTGAVYGICAVPGRGAVGHPHGPTLLASAGGDGTIRLWDPDTERQVGDTLTGHTGPVYEICAVLIWEPGIRSGGRTLLASAGEDGTIRIWDPDAGRQVGDTLAAHAGGVWGVCAVPGRDPDGRTLLASAGADGTVRVWDPGTGQQVGDSLTGHTGALWGVCAVPGRDPDGRTLLASAGADGTVRVWDPGPRRQVGDTLTAHAETVWGVCAVPGRDPDGRTLLASASGDGTIQVWDPDTGRQIGDALAAHAGGVWGVCAVPGRDPDGRTLLATAGGDGTVRIWDPDTGRQIGDILTGHTGLVYGVCAVPGRDPDERTLLASASGDGTVRVWDPDTGRQVGDALAAHTGGVWGVCAVPDRDPDGRTLLATAGEDETIRIWDPDTGRQIGDTLAAHTGGVWGVCAVPDRDPDGRTLLATAGGDGTVRIWDPDTGRQIGDTLAAHAGGVWGVCAVPGRDPDGRTLLATAGGDGTVRIWDPDTGRQIGDTLTGSPDTAHSLATCPPAIGDCLAVDGRGRVRAWKARTASLGTVPSSPHVSAIVVVARPDHIELVSGDTAGHVHLSDLITSMDQCSLQVNHGAVLALCRLPGEPTRVSAAGSEGAIIVITLTEGAEASPVLPGHSGPVRDMCVVERPDNSLLLASAGNDATIWIWDLDTRTAHAGPLTGHDGWVLSLTAFYAPPGSAPRLASAGADHTVRLWDPISGRQIGRPLTGHTDQVRAVTTATSSDGRTLLLSGGYDGTVRLWHPGTAVLLHAIPLGIPVHALLQQQPDPRSRERTDGGATITVGLRTGILALDIHSCLFPAAPGQLPP